MRKTKPTTQAILDYVSYVGPSTYGELHEFYRSLNGSNSFSHILVNLVIPWKNRKTRRYLVKLGEQQSQALYVVRVATPENWVQNDY